MASNISQLDGVAKFLKLGATPINKKTRQIAAPCEFGVAIALISSENNPLA
jgi:hypothetical protein